MATNTKKMTPAKMMQYKDVLHDLANAFEQISRKASNTHRSVSSTWKSWYGCDNYVAAKRALTEISQYFCGMA